MKTAKGAPKSELLTYEEILEVVRAFVALGLRKVRITGGEPLLRPNIGFLLEGLDGISQIESLGITTNGTRLEEFVPFLAKTRFSVNCHVDTLDPERYRLTMRGDDPSTVVKAIIKAIEHKIAIKINSVVTPMTSFEDADRLVAFAAHHDIPVRFIEMMPISDALSVPTSSLPIRMLETKLVEKWRLYPAGREGVTRIYRGLNKVAYVGFITPNDERFCHNCLRFRLSARGILRTCLYSRDGVNLKVLVRGSHPEMLLSVLKDVITHKQMSHGRQGSVIEAMWEVGG